VATNGANATRAQEAPVPPQNLDAEESVLGAMMLSAGAIAAVSEVLSGDGREFYRESHARIFRAALALYTKGEPVDAITLVDELDERGELDDAGGKVRVHELAALVPASANAGHYARIVKETATLRGLIRVGGEIARLGWERPGETAELVDRAEQVLFDLSQERTQGEFSHIEQLLKESFERITHLYESGADVTGVPSGFRDIDRITSGFQEGNLVIVAARPSMGKSALGLGMAANLAVRKDIPVALFTLEMSKSEVTQRLMCSEAKVESQRLRTGKLSADDWPRLTAACDKLAKAPIYVDDTGSITMMEIRSKARRLKSKQPDLGLLIVDYLQLMTSGTTAENRVQEVSQISRALKVLARDLEVPILALSQLSRAVEQRHDKRPILSDLRECVTGDTPVCLADGRRVPIVELVGQMPTVHAIGANGKVVTAKSDKVWPVGVRPIFAIKLATGRTIRATAQHRLLGAAGWARVADLAPGDRVATARTLPEAADVESWPDDRVILLGHLIGDGSYLVHQPMRYTTSSDDNSQAVREAAEREFAADVKRYEGRRTWHQLLLAGNGNRWHPAGVNGWLRGLGIFGQRSYEKRIPRDAFRLSNRQIALLLRHLWATDGSISVAPAGRPDHVYYSTNGHDLAQDIAGLLLRMGIVARIYSTRQGAFRPSYQVVVSGRDNQRRFLAEVGAFGPRAPQAERLSSKLAVMHSNTNVDTLPIESFERVRTLMRSRGISQRAMTALRGTSYGGTSHFRFAPSRALVAEYAEILDDEELAAAAASDLFWDRIVAIEPSAEEDVYDLTVPGPASWLADGIVSHNSGSLEQDADIVCFIYRDEYYAGEESDHQGLAEVIVAKHRNGPTDTVKLSFLKRYAKFADLAA
jgi:replicative DNA helicase